MASSHDAGAALDPAEAVLRFLASVGPSADAELYLRLFRSRAAESFAAVAVEAAAATQDADGVAHDLRFLRALDLTPVVVLGLYDTADAAGNLQRLDALLRAAGLRTALLESGSPHAEIAAAARGGAIPLLLASGEDHAARIAHLSALLAALHTHKLIFLGTQGGLALRGEQLSVVNLSTDYEDLRRSGELAPRQLQILDDARRLILELAPQRLLVSLTSPLNLLHELFTVKGAGTLLRRGAPIARHDGLLGVDLQRLRALLGGSFGKPPSQALFARAFAHVYLEQEYRGAAMVQRTALGGYLSKFAVTREAQGEGIGVDLWSALCSDYPTLIWRARRENPIRPWYERQCQGRFDAGEWTVYFRGLAPAQIAQAVDLALGQPVDF